MELNSKTAIGPSGIWKVLFQDSACWRMGVYRPEHVSPSAITVLERHTCPELFICTGGPMGLLILENGSERVIELESGEAFFTADFHNGFSMSDGGYFLVVERTAFTTVYIDRNSRDVIRTVEVKPE